ncbi:MAG: threonine/serine dehydratase [Synergistaceae bacterium]|jgi:threonine dehydratase|nr:threonine/serine dehydratase [Synergistaceae bacterium]
MPYDVTITDVLRAAKTISGRVRHTPMEFSPSLGKAVGAEVWLKLENQQIAGSFKIRGALNRMSMMNANDRERGVITCSSGNHAQGMAIAARTLGIRAVICVPGQCPQIKREAIIEMGGSYVELRIIGTFFDEAEEEAQRMADREGLLFVSAFDDPLVSAGQGVVGLEILHDEPELDAIICPISGAGLIRGVGVAAKALRRGIKIWGAHANANPSWQEALRIGRVEPVVEEISIADALGGHACQNHFDFVRDELEGVAGVSEREIKNGIKFLLREHRQVAEGGGAVAVAALLAGNIDVAGLKVCAVVSGRNIGLEEFTKAIGE